MLASRLGVGVMLLLAGGCASAGSGTWADRFVKQGVPAVDLGGPRPIPPARGSGVPARTHEPVAASRLSSTASNLESVHPELREATLRVRLAPTIRHHLDVAQAYRKLGILDTAYDYLMQSLALHGPDPEVHDQVARLWRDWGQPGTGLTHAHTAAHLAPEWAVAQNTLGTLLYAMGRRADARSRFERAVALDPGAAYALQNLCVLYQAEGRTREAITACRQPEAARRKGVAARR